MFHCDFSKFFVLIVVDSHFTFDIFLCKFMNGLSFKFEDPLMPLKMFPLEILSYMI